MSESVFEVKAKVVAEYDAKSAKEAGTKAGKAYTKAFNIQAAKEMSTNVGKTIAEGYTKTLRGVLTDKFPKEIAAKTKSKLQGKYGNGTRALYEKLWDSWEKQGLLPTASGFNVDKAKASITKARLKNKYRQSTLAETIATFESMPMRQLGRGGIGRDYVGTSTDYAKMVSDAIQRNASARQNIADRINKQNMYESLWASLDNGGTVFSHSDVTNKDYFGMAIDSVISKAKKLKPIMASFEESLKRIKTFVGRIGRIAVYRAIRTAIKEISQALKEGVSNLYQWSKLQSSGMGNEFAQAMDKIATSLLTVKNSIATVVAPIITALAPAIESLATAFQNLTENLSQFFAMILGTGYYYKAVKNNIAYADSVTAIKNALLGFDELNVLNGSDSSSTIQDYSGLFEKVPMDDTLEQEIATKMISIGSTVGAAQLGLGAILALTGANIPLGIGLMASGALTIGKTVSMNWDYLPDEMQTVLGSMVALTGVGALAVGAILAFSGANIPLGIGLMAAGAIGLATVATLNWDATSDKVKEVISKITFASSALLLGVGCLLAFTGANIPLGVGMILAGSAGLATAATINWDTIKDHLKQAWEGIKNWFTQDVAPKFTKEYWESKGKTIGQGLIEGIVKGWNDNATPELFGNGLLGNLLKGTITFTNTMLNGVGTGFISTKPTTTTTSSNVKDEDWWLKYYGSYASGGTPDTGSLFLAGEAGPELVTQIGGRSTVYNEEQLGNSLAYANEGVISAINTLIGVVQKKSNQVTISASDIRKAVNNSSMRVGV